MNCFDAHRNITPSDDWVRAVTEAIGSCRVMLLILSKDGVGSDYVRREVAYAVQKKIPIIPFRVSEVTPPDQLAFYINDFHWLDAFPGPLEGHPPPASSTPVRSLLAGSAGPPPDRPGLLMPRRSHAGPLGCRLSEVRRSGLTLASPSAIPYARWGSTPAAPGRPKDARVTARLLLPIFDGVYLFALASWVGSIAFFSFGVAPVIFRVLGAEAGGRFVRVLFPRYYAWNVVGAAVALPAFVGVPLAFPEYKGPWVGVQAGLILAGILIFLYCGNSLTPAINAARDAGPEGAERFHRLHRRSVQLNAAALLIGVVLLGAHASRRPPTTSGLREMTLQQRTEYDRQFESALHEMIEFDAEARKELEEMVAAKRDRDAKSAADVGAPPPPPPSRSGPDRPH